MFYCTNLSDAELAGLSVRRGDSPGQLYNDFKMNFPLQVEYIAFHPEDAQNYFTMASIGPDKHYYAAASYEEMGKFLSKKRLHHHTYYELLFVLSGNVYQIIENRRHLYTPGSCCLLNKNVLHTEEHLTDFEVAFLGISDEVLADVYADLRPGFFAVEKNRPLNELDKFLDKSISGMDTYEKKYIDFIPLSDASDAGAEVRRVFEDIVAELINPRIGSSHIVKALIAKLLYLLSDKTRYETNPIRIGTDAENLLYNQIDRIMTETNGRASRSFLERELHYSGDYLNKITKKYTGLCIHDLGMTICMSIAAGELRDTSKGIGDIAASLGFSNRTHFYKQFEKIYRMSPAEYRKTYTKQ